ncbi:hypothetical protein EG68_03993 [Paragonimus skrjabini miyazakii]|uniref:Uncharacterized protein n=1 Tax=Paragonimus skrjabini miyazakii TaxID=59628 RepID=A0A8S9YBV2_9TREM|nr:hypothetical protein EG68_03993 [Paragonimus skrjabini miyazakii]
MWLVRVSRDVSREYTEDQKTGVLTTQIILGIHDELCNLVDHDHDIKQVSTPECEPSPYKRTKTAKLVFECFGSISGYVQGHMVHVVNRVKAR